MTAASRLLATAQSKARFANGLLPKCDTTTGDMTQLFPKLTAGQAHDGRSAADMLDSNGEGQSLLADHGYDSEALPARLENQGACGNIKPMPDRVNISSFSAYLYRFRNLVECFFNKLKHLRAVATR